LNTGSVGVYKFADFWRHRVWSWTWTGTRSFKL